MRVCVCVCVCVSLQVSGAADSVSVARNVLAREVAEAELLQRTTGTTQGSHRDRRGGPLSMTILLGHAHWALSNKAGQVG